MATTTFSLTELQFRKEFIDHLQGGSFAYSSSGTEVDHLNNFIQAAYSMPGSTQIKDDSIRIICAEAVNRFLPNRALDAAASMRKETQEKGRAYREAKKAASNGGGGGEQRMGSTRLDGKDGDDDVKVSSLVEADTTKTLLRSCATGVRWVPEEGVEDKVPHPATKSGTSSKDNDVPIDDAVTSLVRARAVPSGKAWQHVKDIGHSSPGKESTDGNKNVSEAANSPLEQGNSTASGNLPGDMAAAEATPTVHPMIDDLFSAFVTAEAPEEEEEKAVDVDAAIAAAVSEENRPPTPTPYQLIEDETPIEAPVTSPVKETPPVNEDKKANDEDEIKVISDPPAAAEEEEEEEPVSDKMEDAYVPQTPPVPEGDPVEEKEEEKEAENAAASGDPTMEHDKSDDPSEETPSDEAHILLMLTAAFGMTQPTEKESRTGIHGAVWTAVDKVIGNLEEWASENDAFDYSRQPPVSNFYLDKVNVCWLLCRLVAIGFLKGDESLKALDEVEATGYPTTLLNNYRKLSQRKGTEYLNRLISCLETYLSGRPWESQSSSVSKAAKSDPNFDTPTCLFDFIPKSWIYRYCDEVGAQEGRELELKIATLFELNKARAAKGLPERKTIEESEGDLEDEKLIKEILEQLEDDEEDKSYDLSSSEDDSSAADPDKEYDLSKPEKPKTPKKLKSIDGVPKARMKKAPAPKKKKPAAEKKEGSARRKQSKPTKLVAGMGHNPQVEEEDPIVEIDNSPRTTELVGGVKNKKAAAVAAAVAKKARATSPIPEMDPKVEFVALTACPDYHEIRVEAQNGKVKTAKQLNKRVAEETAAKEEEKKKKKSARDENERNSPSAADNREKQIEAALEFLRASLPTKLGPGITIEKLRAALASLAAGETIKHEGCKRLLAEAKEASEYLMTMLTVHMHNRGNLAVKLAELISSGEKLDISPLPEDVSMPRICQVTGSVFNNRQEMYDIRYKDNVLRVGAPAKRLISALSFISNIKQRASESGSSDPASTFVSCHRFLISQIPVGHPKFPIT